MSLRSLFVLLLASTIFITEVDGAAHSTVQVLNSENFDNALADPANGLWLLKFYAPWCGHCKTLSPVLDKVAPHLAGKMAIGKIDCTVEKSLCNKFSVQGFPTLKIHRDGDFFDYPGERHADSIIKFAEKMSSTAVAEALSYDAAIEVGSDGNGVVFVAYDPAAKGQTVDEKLQSSLLLQVFGQIARKQQAHASFALISAETKDEEVAKFGAGTEPFILKIEQDVQSQPYTGEINSVDFLSFVETNNVALVTDLGSSNYRQVGYMGKPLAIMAIDPHAKETNKSFLSELRQVATNADFPIKSNYIFCTMDGIQWKRFLSQFNVDSNKLPTFFVLDVPKKTFWDQPDHADDAKLPVKEFLVAHSKGILPPKAQGTGQRKYPWYFSPYTILGFIAVCMTIFFVMPLSDEEMREINGDEQEGEGEEKKDDNTKKEQ